MFSDCITWWHDRIVKPYVQSNITEIVIENISRVRETKMCGQNLDRDNRFLYCNNTLIGECVEYRVMSRLTFLMTHPVANWGMHCVWLTCDEITYSLDKAEIQEYLLNIPCAPWHHTKRIWEVKIRLQWPLFPKWVVICAALFIQICWICASYHWSCPHDVVPFVVTLLWFCFFFSSRFVESCLISACLDSQTEYQDSVCCRRR